MFDEDIDRKCIKAMKNCLGINFYLHYPAIPQVIIETTSLVIVGGLPGAKLQHSKTSICCQ